MLRSIWNSRSGMAAEMDKLDAISNNMANSTTVGYKRVDVKFNDLMQENLDRLGYPVSKGQGKLQVTGGGVKSTRSEEHTSELQSRQYLVCRLLLEKKKKTIQRILSHTLE